MCLKRFLHLPVDRFRCPLLVDRCPDRRKRRPTNNGPRTTTYNMIQLKEGDKAPAFTGIDQNGHKISLSGYKGHKVILYFYPEDDTPTCTIQACNLRDNYALLKKEGFTILRSEEH